MDKVPVPLLLTLGLGVIGGAALGKSAFEHMFVHGMSDDERRRFVGLGIGAAVVFGAAYALDIDSKWLSVDELAAEINKQVTGNR